MKILNGRHLHTLGAAEMTERIRGCCPVHIDVGTGSGRLMLKASASEPGGFFIGLDPSAESMRENAVKAVKRMRTAASDNLLYVVGSIEALPDELSGIADIISVVLPWGSLRDGIVKADAQILRNLRRLGKQGSALRVLVGYDERIERGEMEKRLLPALSREQLGALAPAYRNAGIALRGIETVRNDELKRLESDWAKKLAYGRERVTYRLDCVYI